MHFLISWTVCRAGVVWIIWAVILGMVLYLILAPGIGHSWRKKVMRGAGALLAIVFVCASLMFDAGILMGAAPPREHTGFTSATGERVAFLSCSSLRDSAATQVSVKTRMLSQTYSLEYFGDGDDYMDRRSVQWIDYHHLAIRYAIDSTGQQTCHPHVGDVIVSCEPHPDPTTQPKI